MTQTQNQRMSGFRWVICTMLFFALTINYLDRQVLSLTWKDFIAPEFHWTDADYGTITGAFAIFYAIGMLFSGKIIDKIGTRKGYLWAIGIWSSAACLHAFCGIATSGILTGHWLVGFEGAKEYIANAQIAASSVWTVSTVSVYLFLVARCALSIGESGNFPSSIKVVAEYFPKKDRAFATGIFNSGAQIGALLAPFTIPLIAHYFGWEMAFVIIGVLGFIWMGFWIFVYDKPKNKKQVNAAELAYIEQDDATEEVKETSEEDAPKVSLWRYFTYRQTWAIIAGRFLPDGVWWFILFWAPAYIKDVCKLRSDDPEAVLMIFVLYLISMLSLAGGYLPTYLIDKRHQTLYNGRMRALLVFALIPIIGVFAQSLGGWFSIIIIGIIAAAHQSWSANVFTVVGDMFPKSMVATVTGISGLSSGLGVFLFTTSSGMLFTYSKEAGISFLQFHGIQAGYMIVFLVCSFAYLFSWCIMKLLIPQYKKIEFKK